MPPGTLRVLPDVLEAQSARLKRLRIDELQATLADLRTVSQRLDGVWSSEARAAFGDTFSGWLSRAAGRGPDLERIAAFLSVTAGDYRALEADLVGAASDVPEHPHQNDATRAHPSPGGGAGFGTGGGLYAGAGGTLSPIALTGNPLEDLWNWLMSLFGAGPQPQPTPTPTATTPMAVGVTPQPMPLPYPWEPTSSDGTSPVVCVADPSTTPADLQPYLINAACTNLVGQLEPDQAALLMQQVESGQTELGLVRVGDFWVLQAIDRGSTEPRILATAQDEDGDGLPDSGGATGAAATGGAGAGAASEAGEVTRRTIQEAEQELARFPQIERTSGYDDLARALASESPGQRSGAQRVLDALAMLGDDAVEVGRPYTGANGATDVDVVTRSGLYIEVGGPAKQANLSHFGQQLAALKTYANDQGGRAVFFYAPGTDPSLIEFAVRRLGPDNVFPIVIGAP